MANSDEGPSLVPGDIVDVKKHGRATVLAPRDPDTGRYLVRYHEDDTTFSVTPGRLRKMHPTTRRVLVAARTEDYRDAAVHNVDRHDVCLEIGCHEGITTHMLSSRCALAIGIDITGAVIAKACARQPSLAHLLHELDGFDIPAVRSLLATTAAAAATAAASTATGGAGGSTQAVTPGASGGAPPPGASSAPASAHAGLQEHAAAPAGHLPGGPCPGDAGVVAPTKVFMDISGKAPAALMVALVRAYLKEFPSARLIVKNEELWAEMERREGAGAGAGRAQGGGAGVACGGGGQGAGIAACGGASGEASAGKGGAGEAFSGQAGHGGPDVAGGGTVVGCGCREAAALLDELGDEVEMFRHSFHPMPKKDKRLAMPRGVPKAPAAAAVPGLAYNAQGTQPPS